MIKDEKGEKRWFIIFVVSCLGKGWGVVIDGKGSLGKGKVMEEDSDVRRLAYFIPFFFLSLKLHFSSICCTHMSIFPIFIPHSYTFLTSLHYTHFNSILLS